VLEEQVAALKPQLQSLNDKLLISESKLRSSEAGQKKKKIRFIFFV
jgi:hypothetical protein